MIQLQERCAINIQDIIKVYGHQNVPESAWEEIRFLCDLSMGAGDGIPRELTMQFVAAIIEIICNTCPKYKEVNRADAVKETLSNLLLSIYTIGVDAKEIQEPPQGVYQCQIMHQPMKKEATDCYGFHPVNEDDQLENRCTNCRMCIRHP